MLKVPFYHGTFKKVVIAFGTLFDGLQIVRKDVDGREVKRITVPINYGPREKFLVRQKDDKDLNRPIDIVLPHMSFEMTSFNYKGMAKLNTMHMQRVTDDDDTHKILKQFNPVVYDIGLQLNIMSKYADDGNQIVEQILPFFTPNYTVTIKSIPELDLKDDVPFTIRSIELLDNYDDDWKDRRNIIWTINFGATVYFYGPITKQGIIRKVSVDTLIPPTDSDLYNPEVLAKIPRVHRHTVEPDPGEAIPESTYGYTETIEDFDDGKKYNPDTGDDEDIE